MFISTISETAKAKRALCFSKVVSSCKKKKCLNKAESLKIIQGNKETTNMELEIEKTRRTGWKSQSTVELTLSVLFANVADEIKPPKK